MGILNNFKIGPKILGGYVIAGVAMAILAYVLLSSISGLNEKFSFLVHHDTPVLMNAEELTAQMISMETGLRGYLVTGEAEFLEPYYAGLEEFEITMAEEQELTSDNPEAVAVLKEIKGLEEEWHLNYAEPAIALREEVEQGWVAQDHFREISARTIGKDKFDAIRALLEEITDKFETADDLGGQFLMKSITLDLVNMEIGQRGYLITGEDASLAPYNDGQLALTSDVAKLRA